MYSKSPRFKLAYEYASKTCDKIFALFAKYGLLSDNKVIKPYDETLNDKTASERQQWARSVLSNLKEYCDLRKDEFFIFAGKNYYEYLIFHLYYYEIPLKGLSLFEWLPRLNKMLNKLDDKEENNSAKLLHQIFNRLPRYKWNDISKVPFYNGIYIMFMLF